ncbi:uncharacterized protein LOC124448228 [Xenia sp. Carnegie-2017]|uniref:uncharacterized protein LOC124448228 n=1 Tax=Xenia sp. Carnegie-2017 TaxID=2897299 RepID=UPI001F047CCA|nr:uncharacterized protein LOC124448228 [Xenia sp. Carnegie-2017]
MARDSADCDIKRMSGLLNEILLSKSLSNETSHLVDSVSNILSGSVYNSMPPLLLTSEDRRILRRDREDAIKMEDHLLKRKQEKYFDLVDKVQIVLHRIQEKKLVKIVHHTERKSGSPSDLNNNSSGEDSVKFSGVEPVQEPTVNHPQLKLQRPNSFYGNHYASHHFPDLPTHHLVEKPSRHPLEHPTHHPPHSQHHSLEQSYNNYECHRPITFSSNDDQLNNENNGCLQQRIEPIQRYPQVYSTHNQSITSTFQNDDQYTNKNARYINQLTFHPQQVDSMLPAHEDEVSVLQQKEYLAKEQQRLEEHYNSLQEKLLFDFQRRQQELLEMYSQSVQLSCEKTQSVTSETSTLESTHMSNERRFERSSVVEQEGFSKSPFGFSATKCSTNLTNAPFNADFVNSTRSLRSLQKPTAKKEGVERTKSTSPNKCASVNAALVLKPTAGKSIPSDKNFFENKAFGKEDVFDKHSSEIFENSYVSGFDQSIISPNSMKTSVVSAFSSSFKSNNIDLKELNQLSFPDQSMLQNEALKHSTGSSLKDSIQVGEILARKSFNSEISAQEFYEFPHYGKAIQRERFCIVSAHAKGFLTRLLFKTGKVQDLVTTIKDARNVLADLSVEYGQSKTDRSFKERVKTQLLFAQNQLRGIFVDSPAYVRMQILNHNRRLLQEKRTRKVSQGQSPRNDVNRQTPKLSDVTMKKRQSRRENQDKTPLSKKHESPQSAKSSKSNGKKRATPNIHTVNTPTSRSRIPPMTKVNPEASTAISDSSTVNSETSTLNSETSVVNTATSTVCNGSPNAGKETKHALVENETYFGNSFTTACEISNSSPAPLISTKSENVVASLSSEGIKKMTTNIVENDASARTNTKSTAIKGNDNRYTGNRPLSKSKNGKINEASKNRRKTWDKGVLRPIQGRLSPPLPSSKTRLSNERKQSVLSTARNVGQNLHNEYQKNSKTPPTTNKCKVSGIDLSKTYKISSKTETALIKKTNAKRSLAANLTRK